MRCELCGAPDANRKAEIEGAVLNVCANCVNLGKEMATVKMIERPKPKIRMPSSMDYDLKDNFGSLIRKSREKKGLTQEELAAKIKEKHSIIKQIEHGWEPPLAVIRKLEKYLNINLIEASAESDYKTKAKRESLTLGDIAELK